MADVEGIKDDVSAYLRRHKGTPRSAKGVHHAYRAVAPHLVPCSFPQVRAVFESGGYFCFAVVRNPFTRIFSAWSDKIVKGRHDNTRHSLADPNIYCRVIANLEDARASFEAFVACLHDTPGMFRSNRHWMPQFLLLRPDLLRYDCITQLENPHALQAALAGILGADFKDPLQGERPKNTSPLSYHPDFITPKAAEYIRALYADDFACFGYDAAVLPPGKQALDPRAVEKTLATVMRQRLQYSYRRLARLELEKRELLDSPARSFVFFLCACRVFFRKPLERMRYAILRLFKK